ncbi:MAG TPA: gluconate 2-dehydrogenase subunit 3 family protein [Nocardioidaceae bacterium]|nr:gluconate 2-dehydrogenase subunit 3 family protein [Nocardioidaceae bacterium]
MTDDIQITRRAAIQGACVAGVALFSGAGPGAAAVAVPVGDERARFLRPEEMRTLEAVVDRVVPGVPEDTVPGALAAGCHEAIDALLGAFTVSPPRIYAGGPFSDRGGSPTNHFEHFLELDVYETTAWRLRIEGSGGRRALERNGPVKGYQTVYREGLSALEASVPGGFSNLPGPARDVALEQSEDPRVREMLDLAVPHTLEFLYGAPEYGGNRDLVGWRTTDYEGDTQPRGFTHEEVLHPEGSGPLDLVTDLIGTEEGVAVAMGSTELLHGVLARSGGRFTASRAEVGRLSSPAPDAAEQLAQMRSLAEELVRAARDGQGESR